MSHTEATLEAAIDTYEDSVTFGNWLRLITQGSCSTLQKRIHFETVMLNNNGVMTQRQQISFYAAHLFILSQQQDQMMFLRVLNQQLAAAGLIQVSTGIQVPFIPEACGEAVERSRYGGLQIVDHSWGERSLVDFGTSLVRTAARRRW